MLNGYLARLYFYRRWVLARFSPSEPALLVSRVRTHGEHVGPMHDPSALDAGDAEHEAEQRVVRIERAGGDPADALHDFENAHRNGVRKALTPRGVLELDARLQLGARDERTDVVRDGVHGIRGGVRGANKVRGGR